MRALILLAGAALALSACGSNGQADNTVNVGESVTADNIVSNDVTAIDAVTGDAANMAADVDINFTNDMLDSGGGASKASDRAPRRGSSPARTRPPRPAAQQPTTNATAPASAPEPGGNLSE